MNPTTIAIIGGGPAGSTAAERLLRPPWPSASTGNGSAAGKLALRVLVFEEKRGWEKPCGGGLSHKALARYPFLVQASAAAKAVSEMEIAAAGGARLQFRLRRPLAIYSRRDLNALLLDRAQGAGAEVIEDHIREIGRAHGGWRLRGRRETYVADFVILAAGARSRLRHTLAGDFDSRDFLLTFGYYVPQREDLLRIEFFEDFEGYAWSFPRSDHLSVGVCGKAGESSMAQLRRLLRRFMERAGLSQKGSEVYSHLLPALSVERWHGLRLAGPGWTIAGDAAGLSDPVTGEGIYFAMRSGELAAESLLAAWGEPGGAPGRCIGSGPGGAQVRLNDLRTHRSPGDTLPDYAERVWVDFGDRLKLGARLAPHFYRADFLGGSATARMVQFAAHSPTFRDLLQDLIEGRQSYSGLAARLYRGLPKSLWEIATAPLRERFAAAP